MQKRPWEISDLLALRDGDLRDASSAVDDAAARQELDKIRDLQAGLQALPDVPLDEAVWNRQLQQPPPRSNWLRFPLATAASVFFASVAGIYFMFGTLDGAQQPGTAQNGAVVAEHGQFDNRGLQLAALMNQSRDLEQRLQGVDPWTLSQADSQVTPPAAGERTASPTEQRLLYRLADVDAQIARLYEAEVMDARTRHALWSQRVNLLQSIVAVRGGSNPRLFEDSRSM